jgi:hypothetical protein
MMTTRANMVMVRNGFDRVKLKNIDKDETAETHGNNEYDHGDNGCSGDG